MGKFSDYNPELAAANERITTLEAELAAMKARGDRLAEALETAPIIGRKEAALDFMRRQNDWLLKKYNQAITEWRDQ